MKIIHFISSLQRGGAETLLVALVRSLQKEGYEQEVIYLHAGHFLRELETLGILCHHLQAWGRYGNPLLWWRLRSTIYQCKPDLLHTSLWAANIMGRLIGRYLGVATIASLHTLPEHEGSLRNFLDRRIPPPRGGTIATSHTIARAMEAAQLHTRHALFCIPSGINIDQLQQEARLYPVRYCKKPGTFLIGSVGRLVPVKQFDKLIALFACLVQRYPFIELLIIGSGPEEARLRADIHSRSLEKYVQIITQQKAAPYYALFDCFILPSLHEGFGLVLLEAMAFSVPVIATSHTEKHEIVQHNINGFVVPPGDFNAWYSALAMYIENPALRVVHSKAGFSIVTERFTEERMVQQYQLAFAQALCAGT